MSSAVIDLGSFETRAGKVFLFLRLIAGYSGEDCPRSVIPSVAGVLAPEYCEESKKEDSEMKGQDKDHLFTGSAALNFKRDHMSIKPLYQEDGMSK